MSIPFFQKFENRYKYDFAASFYNGGSGFQPHLHRYFEIIISLDDGLTVKIDGTPYKMKKNDMILVKPYQIHEITDARYRYIYLFSPDLIPAVSADFIEHELTSPVAEYEGVFPDFLMTELEKAPNMIAKKGILYILCSFFCHNIDHNRKITKIDNKTLLQKIFDFIEDNIGGSCRIEELLDALGHSQSYISRVFTSNVGIPYGEYVRKIKISRACHYLDNTDDTVTETAYKCGYDSLSSFNRAFKAVTGETPTGYRSKKTGKKNSDTSSNVK